MNERIRELAEQAGLRFTQLGLRFTQLMSNPMVPVVDGKETDLEKLAELIVRECIQNIRDNMEHARVDTLGDRDLFLETLRTSGHFYITELEQHFGVKE